MGLANGQELARAVLSWSTAAPAASPAIALHGRFNLSLWGTAAGFAAELQRSFDNGTTWLPCTLGGEPVVFAAAASEIGEEPEAGVLYRLNVSAIASGTLQARISQ